MRLNDRLVTYFYFDDKKYDIDLAFDNVLDVFDVMDDKRLADHEKIKICLSFLLGEQEYDPVQTIDLWNYIYTQFIDFGTQEKRVRYDLKGNPMPVEEDNTKYIDLEKDAEFIYASFMQAYNMNLFEQQGKLHWHEFKALLSGLPTDTIMQRIIQIRAWKPQKGESKEFQQQMRELQEIYALDEEVD